MKPSMMRDVDVIEELAGVLVWPPASARLTFQKAVGRFWHFQTYW